MRKALMPGPNDKKKKSKTKIGIKTTPLLDLYPDWSAGEQPREILKRVFDREDKLRYIIGTYFC